MSMATGRDAQHIQRFQACLANLIDAPHENVFNVHLAHLPTEERWAILTNVKEIIKTALDRKLEPPQRDSEDSEPVLLDRLRFVWTLLKKADSTIKSNAKDGQQKGGDAILDGLLDDMPTSPILAASICRRLCLEPDGRFAHTYARYLRRRTKPGDLKLACSPDHLKRVVTWVLRNRKERYVSLSDGEVKTHELEMTKWIEQDVRGLFADSELKGVTSVRTCIADVMKEWLEYSCIYGQQMPASNQLRIALAEAFVKCNQLNEKIPEIQLAVDAASAVRIRELEAEVARYSEENRKLEGEKSRLETAIAGKESVRPMAPVARTPDESNEGAARELWFFLKDVEARYSFNILRDVQLGDEELLSLPHLISHLFFVLRKRGFVQYPKDDEFVLAYDQSGLFECVDFEVPSGASVQVCVERRGWALISGSRLLPVCKARVKRTGR